MHVYVISALIEGGLYKYLIFSVYLSVSVCLQYLHKSVTTADVTLVIALTLVSETFLLSLYFDFPISRLDVNSSDDETNDITRPCQQLQYSDSAFTKTHLILKINIVINIDI